jgi:hypothetical protein
MNYKTTLTIILLSVFALGILFLLWGHKQFLSSNSYEIAAVSMSGERKEDGISMTRGIKMCLDQVNAAGGIFGKPVHLKLYDDRGDPKEARQIASSLVENQNIRLVLGHFFSSTSFAAGQIYKKYGLPAITASATDPMVTQSNPWYFRVIPTNNTQGQFIAAFIHGAMRQKRASIVYDTDNYGKSLARSFESSALELGIHLVKKWGINCIKNVDKQIKKTVEDLRSIEDLGIIFLAMHSIEAVKLISAIYTADFYLWFRFKGDFDVQNIVFLNAKNPIQLGKPVFENHNNQIKTYTYHIKGIFSTQFNFKMYPFDNQQLNIQFRHQSKPREQIIYIPDISGMGKTGINPSKNNKQLNALNGWEVYRTDIYQSCVSKSSSLGNPSLFENPKQISYSLINVDIGIQRDNLDVAFRTIAPLFFISILMLIATFMPSHRPGLKIGILLTSFISTIIYHNKLLSVLKSIKISFVESIIFVLYALIIVYLIVAVFRYIAYKKVLKRLLKGIFAAELLLFPIVICFCVYWFYFQNVSISELHNSNNFKITDSLAVGKSNKKEDILYWTFTLHIIVQLWFFLV